MCWPQKSYTLFYIKHRYHALFISSCVPLTKIVITSNQRCILKYYPSTWYAIGLWSEVVKDEFGSAYIWYEPTLRQYIGDCMALTININNGIKEPTNGYQFLWYRSNIGIWWVCEGERILIYMSCLWVNIILNHIETRAILSR